MRNIESPKSLDKETVIQTVSIPNKPDNLKFYFRINIWKSDTFETILS